MRELVDVHYPHAPLIRVVLDNLSTHRLSALYQAFSPSEARRIARRLELHHTSKHASWLNTVEIEIGVLKEQCLDRRIGDRATLEREIAAWQVKRNASGAKIQWMFDVARAREKMAHDYPKLMSIEDEDAKPLAPREPVKITVSRYKKSRAFINGSLVSRRLTLSCRFLGFCLGRYRRSRCQSNVHSAACCLFLANRFGNSCDVVIVLFGDGFANLTNFVEYGVCFFHEFIPPAIPWVCK